MLYELSYNFSIYEQLKLRDIDECQVNDFKDIFCILRLANAKDLDFGG